MTSLSERALGQADRHGSPGGRAGGEERSRDLQKVELAMLDGTCVVGMLHRAPGIRTLDYLNRQVEGFVAMTDATVTFGESIEQVEFVAINKAHIVRVVEVADPD